MSGPILYVTGTNTGVGKTMIATLLLKRARERNISMAALKPFCSGGREDAELLHGLQAPGATIEEVNPFFFKDAITPLLAARNVGRRVALEDALKSIRAAQARNLPLLVEGAGGLLSPLGEGFSLFEIMERDPGKVCVVGTNALGVLNLALLTARQLSVKPSEQTIVLMGTAEPDASARGNGPLLRSLLPGVSIFEIEFLTGRETGAQTKASVDSILDWWLGN